jgi:hypothetical protein
LVDVPKDKDVISVKWIYKTKQDAEGNVHKHKVRLVARGFTQQPGNDFNETFTLVACMDTIRNVLSIIVQNKWSVYQMDVKSTFLNERLEEEVYVEQPQGYEVPRQENKVYRLKKELYGLKKAPRAWYSQIDSYLTNAGASPTSSEPTRKRRTAGQAPTQILKPLEIVARTLMWRFNGAHLYIVNGP